MNDTPITTENPQSNSACEHLHQIMGNMIHVQLVGKHEHDDPVRDVLSAAAHGICAAVHGTASFAPGQIAFRKDVIL